VKLVVVNDKSEGSVALHLSCGWFYLSIYLSILWAGVQPTLDPYDEAFYSRPIALTLGGEEFWLMMYASVCVTVG